MSCTRCLVVVLIGVLGCAPDFDPLPTTQSPLTFGDKFFTIACERVAYTSSRRAHAFNPDLPVDVSGTQYRQACRYGASRLPADAGSRDPKVATLLEFRGEMVDAVNLIFPSAELSDLQDYMISILPLTDDDSFPDLVRKGASVIETLEKDTDLHWGLARLDGRMGYRPHDVCLGLMRELLRYDKLHPTLNTLLGLVAEGGKGHQAFIDLVQALSLELRTTRKIHDPGRPDPQHPGTADRTLRLALDLLFTENTGFGSGSMLMVRRDWRGLSKVRGTPLPAPFVDNNTDGLADIDSTFSTFATSPANAPVPPPFVWDKSQPDPAAKRDAQGRALDTSGQPIYEYVNLDRTLLAALSRDAAAIMDPVTASRGRNGVRAPRC